MMPTAFWLHWACFSGELTEAYVRLKIGTMKYWFARTSTDGWTTRLLGGSVRRISVFLLAVLLLLSAAAMFSLIRAWRAERTSPLTCNLSFEPTPPSPLRYIEIELRQQHPIEPSFSGSLFALFQKDPDRQIQVWGA